MFFTSKKTVWIANNGPKLTEKDQDKIDKFYLSNKGLKLLDDN